MYLTASRKACQTAHHFVQLLCCNSQYCYLENDTHIILSCTELEMSHSLKHAHIHFESGLVVRVEMRSCDITQQVVYDSEM